MHTIRLRGPWQLTRDGSDDRRDAETITLPAAISKLGFEIDSSLTLMRRFHRPSGLVAGQDVSVVIDTPLRLVEVSLNDAPLQANESGRYPIQHRLAECNLLKIRLKVNPAALENSASVTALDVQIEIDD